MDFWYQNHCKPRLRPKTQEEYEGRIYQHIIPELGNIPLGKLTKNDLQQFYNRLKTQGRLTQTELYGKGLSDRMVRRCHVTCRAALDRAVQDKLIQVNPAIGCRLPSDTKQEMKILTREEMQRLLLQAKEDDCYELFLLELSTGLRRGEILALQWNDLNMETGELRVTKQVTRVRGELVISEPKTKASIRTIVLPPALVRMLQKYRKATDSRWIFPSPRKEDSPLDPAAVRKKLAIVLERAGCKHVRFHDLRHTFATTALEYGMDVKTLSTMVGHVSAKTTLNIYTHITDDMRTAAAANIDQGIAKQTPIAKQKQSKCRKNAAENSFQPHKGKYRKPGTGCVTQISDHLWEGRYSPKVNGKRMARNIYAPTEAECEEKLAELIAEMKKEFAPLRGKAS
jgi:integrase